MPYIPYRKSDFMKFWEYYHSKSVRLAIVFGYLSLIGSILAKLLLAAKLGDLKLNIIPMLLLPQSILILGVTILLFKYPFGEVSE